MAKKNLRKRRNLRRARKNPDNAYFDKYLKSHLTTALVAVRKALANFPKTGKVSVGKKLANIVKALGSLGARRRR